MINKAILAGNLTRDPEIRFLPNGTPVANCALAINRTWKDEAGNKKEEVCFVDFQAWGRLAENLSQYMKKGGQILLEGRLKLEQWDDKNSGQHRQRLVVVAEQIQFLGKAEGEAKNAPKPAAKREANPKAEEPPIDEDDSVPF